MSLNQDKSYIYWMWKIQIKYLIVKMSLDVLKNIYSTRKMGEILKNLEKKIQKHYDWYA